MEGKGVEWRGGEGSGREGREETKMDCYNNNIFLHKKTSTDVRIVHCL